MADPYRITDQICVIESKPMNVKYSLCAVKSRDKVIGFAIWSSVANDWVFGSLITPMQWSQCWQKIETLMS